MISRNNKYSSDRQRRAFTMIPNSQIPNIEKSIVTHYDKLVKSPNSYRLNKLIKTFATVCPDIMDELNWFPGSISFKFAQQFVLISEPLSRRHPTMVHRFEFKSHMVVVRPTDIQTSNLQPEIVDNVLTMTVDQAGLLAVYMINRRNTEESASVTPMSNLYFAKRKIPALAKALNRSIYEVVATINASCQFGGEQLSDSDGAVGLLAAVLFVRNEKSKLNQLRYISTVYQRYMAERKPIQRHVYLTYAAFAVGGLPDGYSFNDLVDTLTMDAKSISRDIYSDFPENNIKTGRQSILNKYTKPKVGDEADLKGASLP